MLLLYMEISFLFVIYYCIYLHTAFTYILLYTICAYQTHALSNYLPTYLSNLFTYTASALLLGSLAVSAYLIARVLEGECPDNTNIWESQGCNYFAENHGLPPEQLLVVVLYTLIFQTFIVVCV